MNRIKLKRINNEMLQALHIYLSEKSFETV